MERSALIEEALKTANKTLGQEVVASDSDVLTFLFESCDITVADAAEYTFSVNCGGVMQSVIDARLRYLTRDEVFEKEIYHFGRVVCAYSGWYDFGHCTPDWSNVLKHGFKGLSDRLTAAAIADKTASHDKYYFKSMEVLSAARHFLTRIAWLHRERGSEIPALAYEHLSHSAPESLREAMCMVAAYYTIVQFIEGTSIRSIGHLDILLQPYFERDLSSGKLTEEQARAMVNKFIHELDEMKIGSNIPFMLSGTVNGKSADNTMTRLLLEEYALLQPANVKIHYLYDKNTATPLVMTALNSIRRGGNSIVFMNDEVVRSSLVKLGFDDVDAQNYSVIGCYEPCAHGEMPCSCAGRVNLPMVIEAVISNGRDLLTDRVIGRTDLPYPKDYDGFIENFCRQLEYFCRAAMDVTDEKEELYPKLHSSPMFSASMDSCVSEGRDVYAGYGAKYNSTSVNLQGLANAADAIYAIKRLVYAEKKLKLTELYKILKNDWKGNEKLRLNIKNKYPHYGNNDPEVDKIAANVVETASGFINGKPNKKGGIYRLGTFSVDWRFLFGKHTGASADGRKAGEPLSKNTGAAFGADKNGVTAHILSACALDNTVTPNGSVIDIVMHNTAAQGEDGLVALRATLDAFCDKHGFAIHYNVLNADTLRAAQKDPKLYPNLQIRLCGWNVLFSSLSPEEQNEFIAKAEA